MLRIPAGDQGTNKIDLYVCLRIGHEDCHGSSDPRNSYLAMLLSKMCLIDAWDSAIPGEHFEKSFRKPSFNIQSES